MALFIVPLVLAQASGPGGLPMWIILLIVLLLIVLIFWAVTKPTSEPDHGQEETVGLDNPETTNDADVDTAVTEAEPAAENEPGNE